MHPLVVDLLDYKWRKFGLAYYSLYLMLYGIFLGFLTSVFLLHPSPLSHLCMSYCPCACILTYFNNTLIHNRCSYIYIYMYMYMYMLYHPCECNIRFIRTKPSGLRPSGSVRINRILHKRGV